MTKVNRVETTEEQINKLKQLAKLMNGIASRLTMEGISTAYMLQDQGRPTTGNYQTIIPKITKEM